MKFLNVTRRVKGHDDQSGRPSRELLLTALSIFRIIFGLLFILHATQKLFQWPAPTPMPIPVGSWPAWWAGLIELVCGVLITVGFFTRIAAFIASGEMAFAYF